MITWSIVILHVYFYFKEIIDQLVSGSDPPLRPDCSIDDDEYSSTERKSLERCMELMRSCWQEHPDNRPNIKQINRSIAKLNRGRSVQSIQMIIFKKPIDRNLAIICLHPRHTDKHFRLLMIPLGKAKPLLSNTARQKVDLDLWP